MRVGCHQCTLFCSAVKLRSEAKHIFSDTSTRYTLKPRRVTPEIRDKRLQGAMPEAEAE